MKKIVFMVPVIALMAAGCNTSSSPAPAAQSSQVPAPAQNQQKVVTYNGSVFSPSTLTIKKGDSVTFKNTSTGKMSVASDPHPTHTNYPEFDQYKSPERGKSSYTFVFQKTGNWGYHNHLNPDAVGTIVVQ